MKKHLVSGLLTICLFCFVACDRSQLYGDSQRVDEKGWRADDKLVFNFMADDTTTTYTCFIDIRNKKDYPYSNIYLSLTTIYPQGEIAVDTNLEFQLAERDGRWLGRDNGRYVSGRYPFCRFRFPEKGRYQFIIGQAMRETKLPGIKNIGIVISK